VGRSTYLVLGDRGAGNSSDETRNRSQIATGSLQHHVPHCRPGAFPHKEGLETLAPERRSVARSLAPLRMPALEAALVPKLGVGLEARQRQMDAQGRRSWLGHQRKFGFQRLGKLLLHVCGEHRLVGV
jgi:hypothetical protein